MKEIDKKIEQDARNLANEKLTEAMGDREEERRVKQKEAEMDDLIRQMAKIIIEENEEMVGKDLSDRAKKKIDNETKEDNNEKKQKTTRRTKKQSNN